MRRAAAAGGGLGSCATERRVALLMVQVEVPVTVRLAARKKG